MLTRVFLCLFFLFAIPVVQAETEEIFHFKSALDEKRYQAIVAELRCPKCQNQNIADSHAPIALDLRRHVYQMINAGKSDLEITDYMVARYGEFVLYRPQKNANNFLLWYGPFIILAMGLVGFAFIIWRNFKRSQMQKGIK